MLEWGYCTETASIYMSVDCTSDENHLLNTKVSSLFFFFFFFNRAGHVIIKQASLTAGEQTNASGHPAV